MKKTIEFIPYELQNVIDYQEIGNAIDNYCDIKLAELEQIKRNRNIFTADEETIKQYEILLNIVPEASATLDERRYAIWLKLITKIPYSEQWLRHWLTKLLGRENYSLTFDYSNYSFILKIGLNNTYNYNKIVEMLDTIVPAHINYIVTYLYNDWQEAYEKYDWETISNWTWEDVLRNENF